MNNYRKELNLNNIFERFGTEDLSLYLIFIMKQKINKHIFIIIFYSIPINQF